MFGLGWSEMVLVGIVALIVIGPKDLPGMFRTLGQFTGKARGMAREFSRAMEAAADESGMKDISKTVRAAANPQKFGVDKIKEATGMTQASDKPALSPERQAMKEKMSDAMGKAATDRKEREAEQEAASAAAPAETPESDSK
jgi:sec-independent protein translocase protein TatB